MKIAIVHDRKETLERLGGIVLGVPGRDLLWMARDGVQAVTKCAIATPDVVLMKIDLPDLSAVAITRQIMARSPTALVALTDDLPGNTAKIFEAMGHGLLDVVRIPDDASGGELLLRKIATIARLLGMPGERRPPSGALPPLVAIGASTGGPTALATILSALPARFDAAIVVVQHLEPLFLPGLVNWLVRQTSLPVSIATEGEYLEAGKVLVANTGDHLRLTGDSRLTYSKLPRDLVYRPSIDIFFDSVADRTNARGIGVLLTGMGKDGAAGLAGLKRRGWHTIVQSRATCVVYGMPKAALSLRAATEVLDVGAIAPALQRKLAALPRSPAFYPLVTTES